MEVQLALGEVHVYDTIANPDLRQELADVTQSFTAIPEYVVFFSPSGVESSIDFLRLVESDLSSVKVNKSYFGFGLFLKWFCLVYCYWSCDGKKTD